MSETLALSDIHSKSLAVKVDSMGQRSKNRLLRSFARWFILENGPSTAAIISEAFNKVAHHGVRTDQAGTILNTDPHFKASTETEVQGFTGRTYKVKIFILIDKTPPEVAAATLKR